MKLPIYQVDAFTDHLFGGNPAGVCPLEQWLPDEVMQNIAMENNLAETAFFTREGDSFHIRWFTPLVEVDLCGHATLASAHVLFNHLGWNRPAICFESRSGLLTVRKQKDILTLDFPVDRIKRTEPSRLLLKCLNMMPVEVWRGKTDYMVVLGSQKEVEDFIPDLPAMMNLDVRGIIITARGDTCDFVSRFFAPQSGVPEDPVTGSAHTSLTPYWSNHLGKTELEAFQLSRRKGYLKCKMKGDRVEISGYAVTYLNGEICV